jgi:hypothetical protein
MGHEAMHFLNTSYGRFCTVTVAGAAFILSIIILLFPSLLELLIPGLAMSIQDRVSVCGLLLTLVIMMTGIPQLLSLAETVRSSHYSQLDGTYFGLLKIAIDKPHLRNPSCLTEEQAAEYNSYAFAVWNFLETLRDRCEDDQTLKDIWAPVIATEHALHGAWFYEQTTPYWEKEAPKFRLPFADFIWTRFRKENPVCGNVLHRESARWIEESWKLRDVATVEWDRDPNIKFCLGKPKQPSSV